MIRKNKILIAMQISMLAWSGYTFAADRVYVANEGADSVNVLDAASLKTVDKVHVGKMPHNVQVSPDNKTVWVTNLGANGTHSSGSEHMDMSKDAHSEKMDMGKDSHAGKKEHGEIWVINAENDTVIAKLPVGAHPAHVVVTPDGKMAYISNSADNTISVIDAEHLKNLTTINVGKFPHGLRVSPDGKEVYIANMKGGSVSVVDTASNKEVAQIPLGKMPAQVGFSPDGKLVFVSLSGEDAVAVIDTATRKVVKKINVGTVPIQLFGTPDGKSMLVTNQGSKSKPGNTINMIDIASLTVAKTITTGDGAHGVVVDKNGKYAYVTNSFANSVSMIDINERKVVNTLPVDNNPNGISWGSVDVTPK